MKLCVDCKHYGDNFPQADVCRQEQAATGFVRQVDYFTCESMRKGICGRDATLFEEKDWVKSVNENMKGAA